MENSGRKSNSLYPQVNYTNPDSNSPFSSDSTGKSSLYPSSIEIKDLAENLFPATEEEEREAKGAMNTASFDSSEEVIIRIPGALLHLIDKDQSVELASGELSIVQLKQGGNIVAALARVGEEIQWPLAKDEATVKLDDSHYFFTLRGPREAGESSTDTILNYGLTIAAKGQEKSLAELDKLLEKFSSFKVEKATAKEKEWWGTVAKKVSPSEMVDNKEQVEKSAAAYWTTLAPNVEDFSRSFARMIAAGSGMVIRGILWCGDVTVDRLNWGNELLKKKVGKGPVSEISPQAMRRVQRAKRVTKMTEEVTVGILSGVVKVSGFFTSSVANSKAGQKFFSLLPGEIVLASLEGFNKICDAVEVAGKNVMSTTSVVTTGLVSQRYGEKAGKMTSEGLDAAGHAIGTAWAVFKIHKALNPKGVLKPTRIAKAAVQTKLNKSS